MHMAFTLHANDVKLSVLHICFYLEFVVRPFPNDDDDVTKLSIE